MATPHTRRPTQRSDDLDSRLAIDSSDREKTKTPPQEQLRSVPLLSQDQAELQTLQYRSSTTRRPSEKQAVPRSGLSSTDPHIAHPSRSSQDDRLNSHPLSPPQYTISPQVQRLQHSPPQNHRIYNSTHSDNKGARVRSRRTAPDSTDISSALGDLVLEHAPRSSHYEPLPHHPRTNKRSRAARPNLLRQTSNDSGYLTCSSMQDDHSGSKRTESGESDQECDKKDIRSRGGKRNRKPPPLKHHPRSSDSEQELHLAAQHHHSHHSHHSGNHTPDRQVHHHRHHSHSRSFSSSPQPEPRPSSYHSPNHHHHSHHIQQHLQTMRSLPGSPQDAQFATYAPDFQQRQGNPQLSPLTRPSQHVSYASQQPQLLSTGYQPSRQFQFQQQQQQSQPHRHTSRINTPMSGFYPGQGVMSMPSPTSSHGFGSHHSMVNMYRGGGGGGSRSSMMSGMSPPTLGPNMHGMGGVYNPVLAQPPQAPGPTVNMINMSQPNGAPVMSGSMNNPGGANGIGGGGQDYATFSAMTGNHIETQPHASPHYAGEMGVGYPNAMPLTRSQELPPPPGVYGHPRHPSFAKPDYRRFCFSVGKADVPYAAVGAAAPSLGVGSIWG